MMLSGTCCNCRSTSSGVMIGLALVLLLVCTSFTNAEIHRAKAINSKPYHAGRVSSFKVKELQAQQLKEASAWNLSSWSECFDGWTNSLTYDDRYHVWVYSLISAALVGLSGVFPLLVIPLEVGESLKKGGE